MARIAKPLAAAAILALLASPVMAAEAAPAAPAAPAGDQSFEIHDPEDTPPVNYRSEEDPRYDTERQRDAEMYAEQYEQERVERQLKEKKMLNNMNTFISPDGPMNSDLGNNDAGFPARAPY